ncbi:MAG TPA: DUF1684 domain-containing protein [Ktedonobacterales bacterium]|nr:DUF1684 domain-containing protein [Ktedonobacterales bacterium]
MSDRDTTEPTWLDLYDFRRRMAALYAQREAALRGGEGEPGPLARFRAGKDDLFARHPQTPFGPEELAMFGGLRYFPYDAALCVEATLTPLADAEMDDLPASGAHAMRFRRAARLEFALDGAPSSLLVYWIDVYGGGLFLPFRDATSGQETYGGGRYLFDTVKGSDFLRRDGHEQTMGYAGGRVLLDFNYAYNPSCAYDARWVCPLAPNDNRLPLPIRAGERNYHE